jgi:hypothetical protein
MDLINVSPKPDNRSGLEYAYAGRLDLSECDRVIVYPLSSDREDIIVHSDLNVSLETIVCLSFEGTVVF